MFVPVEYITNDIKTILDKLKNVYSLKTDTELSKKIGVTKSFLSRLKAGERSLSPNKMREVEELLYARRIITCSYLCTDCTSLSIETSNISRERKLDIISQVRGKCQLCMLDAPFTDGDGVPYLIVKSLREYKFDEQDIMLALCPNCSARVSILQNESDLAVLRDCTNL